MNLYALERYLDLKKEIKSMEEAIGELKIYQKDYRIYGMPKGEYRKTDITGETAAKIADAITVYQKRIAEIADILGRVENCISTLKDPRHRSVLRLSYINGKTCERIAEDWDMDPRTIYRIKKEARNKFMLAKPKE